MSAAEKPGRRRVIVASIVAVVAAGIAVVLFRRAGAPVPAFAAIGILTAAAVLVIALRRPGTPLNGGARRLPGILALVVAWLALLSSAALLYFQVQLQSDSLFLEDVSRNILSQGGDWENWRLTPAPAYVPDMLLYFLAFSLGPSVVMHIWFVSFVQAILLGLAMMFLTRQVQGAFRLRTQALAVGLVAAITLASAFSEVWVYFQSTNNHFASLLFGLVATGLVIQVFRGGRWRWPAVAGLVLSGVAGLASTSIYLLAVAAPLVAAMGTILVIGVIGRRGSPRTRRSAIIVGVAVAVGVLLGLLVSALVTPDQPTGGRFGLSGALAVRGLSALKTSLLYVLGDGGPVVLGLFLFFAIALGYLIVRAVRAGSPRRELPDRRLGVSVVVPRLDPLDSRAALALGTWIAAWSLVIDVSGSVASGGIVDPHGYRYFLFPLVLIAALAVIDVSMRHVERARWGGIGTLLVAAVLLVAVALGAPGRIAHPRADPISTPAAACLQDVRDAGVDIDSGIADYWLTRGVGFQLDPSPAIVPVWATLEPFYWMWSIDAVEHPDRYPPRVYNFAIVHQGSTGDEGAPWNMNEVALAEMLPAPDEVFECESGDLEIWTWDDDAMDDVVTGFWADWISRGE